MEKRFDMMDFEESLREHADRFTLIPTRKVWISLYNDLHPGSRWPSKTISLLLIFSVIMVGNLNSGSKKIKPSQLSSPQNITSPKISQNHTIQTKNIIAANLPTKVKKESGFTSSVAAVIKPGSDVKNVSPRVLNNSIIPISNIKVQTTETARNFPSNSEPVITNKTATVDNNSISVNTPIIEVKSSAMIVEPPKLQKYIIPGIEIQEKFIKSTESINSESHIENSIAINNQVEFDKLLVNQSEKKISLKKIRKSTWTFYITPSVSSAMFTASPIPQSSVSNNSPLMVGASNITANRKYNSKLSLSAGATSSLPINDRLHFTSGFMLNYLGYRITSNFIHPTFANLVLKDKTGIAYLKSYITHYGNGLGYGQIQLNNYSYQFAVPIGLEYSIIKNQKINWEIGSSIAPSVVLASQSYILSAEGRNYVTDPGLGRRFNLLANFETFITFKSAHIKWHIGPTFGYQTLSTFKNYYPEREHLFDYGFKIGLSR